MTFDEALELLRGLPGRYVEVSVGVLDDDGELQSLAGFSGTPTELRRSPRMAGERWYVDFTREDGEEMAHHVTLDRGLFEDGEVESSGMSLEDVIAEEGDEGPRGTTWAIKLRHEGVVTDILIYV